MTQDISRRREFLKRAALIGSALALPSGVGRAAALTRTAPLVEGPYYPPGWPRTVADFSVDDNADLLWVNGKARFARGTILEVSGRVLDSNGRPLPNIEVHLWQCDNFGRYHHPSDTHTSQIDANFQGRGRAVSDGDGRYAFRTIKPVQYPGRTPHLHFKLKNASSANLLTTQMFAGGDPRNQQDGIYNALSAAQKNSVTTTLSAAQAITVGGAQRQRVRGVFNMVLGVTPALD